MQVSLACPDWADRLASGRSLIPDLPLDASRAARAVAIFSKLRLPDVIGQPPMGEACGVWQKDIVGALFGGFEPDSEARFIREVFNLVPKKNNKTTGGAGIMMTALIMNQRPRAEFLLIGPTQAVSDAAFSQAVGMIEADPYLLRRFHPRDHLKEIRDRTNGARLKIKTFDTKVLVGVKPVGVLIDELHELGKIAHAAKVLRQIRGGILPFSEGFLVFITTQSDEAPAGIFLDELKKARGIRDGKIIGNMLPVLYEFPEGMMRSGAWRDPANWWMVTPNRDRSITIEGLIADFAAEEPKGEEAVKLWASQHLNIQIGVALGTETWVGAQFWEQNADTEITLEEIKRRCDVVVVGIDGGGLDDLLGLCVLGRCAWTGKRLAWFRAWAHKIVLKRRPEIASKLEDFEKAGTLRIVEKPGQDVDEVADIVIGLDETGLLPDKAAVAVDQVGIGAVLRALSAKDFDISIEGGRIAGISQGWRLSGAIKDVERDLAAGELQHDGSGLMNWSIGNCKQEPKGNAITITKAVSGPAKIDGPMALFDAQSLMNQNPQASGGRVSADYELPIWG